MLIVFDFHGVLSLLSSDIINLKNELRIFDENNWYSAMKKSNISPFIMMPTLYDVISFIDNIKLSFCENHLLNFYQQNVYFGIASMGENNNFMIDMMQYCFESQNRISPFNSKNVVGNYKNKTRYDKLPHINIIFNNYLSNFIDIKNIILIDDSINIVKNMTSKGISCILVEKYFTIEDWNRGCYEL